MRLPIPDLCPLSGGVAAAGFILVLIVPPAMAVGLEQIGGDGMELASSMDGGTPLDELKIRAGAGDPDALYACARIALLGLQGQPIDRPRGLTWLAEAARRGHPEAQHFLAVDRLRDGWSEESLAEVLPHLRDAADKLPAAQEFLLFLYRTAPWMELPPGALRTAFLESCAEAGSAEAAYELGLLAESSDEAENAQRLYRLAAQRGSLRALARIREPGAADERRQTPDSPPPAPRPDALPPFEQAMAVARGYAAGTPADVLAGLEKAATLGHPVAQYQLGRLLSTGPDSETGDEARAFAWLLAAAEGENPDAMYAIAEAFSAGSLGVDPDFERAQLWYLEAGRRGHSEAATRLGEGYLAQDGLFFQDPVAAVAWLERAARDGHLRAQYQLALLLERGPPFLRDRAAARQLFEAAGMRGLPAARERLAFMLMEETDAEPALTHALALFYTLPDDAGSPVRELERALPEAAVERARGLARYLSFGLSGN